MNTSIFIERDVESAYGSDVSSNSRMELKKESFSIQESVAGKHNWFQWLKHQVREYMILEVLLLITLVFIIINSYRLSSHNQETQETQDMISDLRTEFSLLRKQMVGNEFAVSKNEGKDASEKILKKLEELEEMEKVKSDVNVHKPSSPTETRIIEKISVISETQDIPSDKTFRRFNAASFMNLAKIDTSRSSSSNLNPSFGLDQSNLILVDRPEPPADKAWCTYEKNPVLTVNLAKYIKPTAVSYQHSKWNETIPDDAPKVYDVVACLDYDCEVRKLLITNCEYKAIRENESKPEQSCNIKTDSLSSPIGKVQFHFRKNHGNSERTCVSLIRVYSEDMEIIKEKSVADAEKCSTLKHDYHNGPLKYQYFDFKNCSDLYSKGCCEDCPECCQECLIKDSKPIIGAFAIVFLIIISVSLTVFLCVGIAVLCDE